MTAPESEAALIERALRGDKTAFDRLVQPQRRELHIHCYRMLGSLHDAEDLVQESMLRAWRGLRTFRRDGPLRPWLYRIATNTCLNHLRRRPRVVVPADEEPGRPRAVEVPWLEPYPDSMFDVADPHADPADRAVVRSETSLGFLCAVQLLPPLQRAVLILREVLSFSASETADLLETTPAAVNSALQRARGRLDPSVRDEPPFAERPAAPEEEMLVRRFMRAWESADIPALVALLRHDATLAMPPAPMWFRGHDAIGGFLSKVPAEGRLDQIPLLRTRANGRPAVAAYMLDPASRRPEAYGIMVLTITEGAIGQITGFADPDLFRFFALPSQLDDATRSRAR